MKHTFIILFFTVLFTACNFKGKENPQSAKNVDEQKEKIETALSDLLQKGEINKDNYELILKRLTTDCDAYLNSDDMTCDEIKAMVENTRLEFENLKINQELYSIIVETYFTIATSNQVRNLSNVKEYCNPAESLHAWYESGQTFDDRLDIARSKIKLMKSNAAGNKNITLKGMDSIVTAINTDIDLIKKNPEDSLQVYDILCKGISRFNEKNLDNSVIEDIAGVYYMLAKVTTKDFNPIIDDFLNQNIKQPDPLTYDELKQSVQLRLDWMLDEDLISKKDHETLETIMLDDINTFFKGSQSKDQLMERIEMSLSKLKKIPLDTEDRESVAETYYYLAKHNDLDIGKKLDKWMYDF